ncbi:hypothetical protein CRE_04874 [Caenorhabditis remanei]|uniref:L-Fucosyltransferase n=2 Tax=Caenorhabditis remanei TaxID=31234 RepID=E3LYL4_CAERE|nr:hypothetical protein CRE_04874 [Caenorhabditis remanei]
MLHGKLVQVIVLLLLVLFLLNDQLEGRYQWGRRFRTNRIISFLTEKTSSDIMHSTPKHPPKGYLSSKLASSARLGWKSKSSKKHERITANHIFELVSIYGISKTLHRKPAIFIEDSKYHSLVNGVRKVMPGLLNEFQIFDRPVFPEAKNELISQKCCVFDNPSKLENITSKYLHLTGHFYQSWRYFDQHLSEIKSFVKPLLDFSPLPESDENNFITCIHIRRTDFVDGQHHSSNVTFFKPALEFIQSRERERNGRKNMLTVLMGDDPNFEANIYENTVIADKRTEIKNAAEYFVSKNSPDNDLAFSRYHCDTVLITAPSSTFGWWLGYLSKRQNVYYQDIRSTNDVNYKKGELNPDDFFVPRWTSIKLDENGTIVVV